MRSTMVMESASACVEREGADSTRRWLWWCTPDAQVWAEDDSASHSGVESLRGLLSSSTADAFWGLLRAGPSPQQCRGEEKSDGNRFLTTGKIAESLPETASGWDREEEAEVRYILSLQDGLQKLPILPFYKHQRTEDLFMIRTIKDHATIFLGSAAVGSGFLVAAFLRFLPNGEHYFAAAHFAKASVLMIIAVASHFNGRRSRSAKSLQETLRVVRLHEILCVLCVAVSTLLALEVYPHEAFCHRVAMEMYQSESLAYELCCRDIYPHTVSFQLLPMFVLEFRHFLVIPFIALMPVFMFGVGRAFAPMDNSMDLMWKIVFHGAVAMGCCLGLWRSSHFNRRHFEAWIEMKRNHRKLQMRRSALDAVIRNLLPPFVMHKLLSGQAPFDATTDASTGICQIADYFQWSHEVTPNQLVTVVDGLFSLFDESCRNRFKLTKAKTLGDCYISTNLGCSVEQETRFRTLDVVQFALWQLRTTAQFSNITLRPLVVSVGVDSGSTFGGIIGTQTLWYELYGPAFEGARDLARLAPPNTVLVGHSTASLCSPDLVLGGAVNGVVAETRKCSGVLVKGTRSLRESKAPLLARAADSYALPRKTEIAGEMPRRSVPSLTSFESLEGLDSPSTNGSVALPSPDPSLDRARHQVVRQRLLNRRGSVNLSGSIVETMQAIDRSAFWLTGTNHSVSKLLDGVNPTPKSGLRSRAEDARPSAQGTGAPETAGEPPSGSGDRSFFGLHEVTAVQEQLEEARRRADNAFVVDLSFPNAYLESRYNEYLDVLSRKQNRWTIAPYFFTFICGLIFVPLVEGSATVPGTALLAGSTIVGLAMVVRSSPKATISKWTEFTLVTALYCTAIASLGLQEKSVANASFLFPFFLMVFFSTYLLLRLPWWAISAHIIIIAVLQHVVSSWYHAQRLAFVVDRYIAVIFTLFMMASARRLEQRRRAYFADVAMSKLLLEAEGNEYSMLRALLVMVVPSSMVDVVVAKSEGRRKAIIESLGDICVGMIRFESLTEGLSPLLARPMEALEMVERLYQLVETAMEGHKFIEKVSTVGDVMMLAGPLCEHALLRTCDDCGDVRVHSVGARRLKRGEDDLLSAAVSLVDVIKVLLRSVERKVSVMLHCDSAYAAVIGVQPATFSVLGQATRKAEALLDALPPGMHAITSAFRRLLHDGKIDLPRDADDLCVGTPQLWRLRGAGVAVVHRVDFGAAAASEASGTPLESIPSLTVTNPSVFQPPRGPSLSPQATPLISIETFGDFSSPSSAARTPQEGAQSPASATPTEVNPREPEQPQP